MWLLQALCLIAVDDLNHLHTGNARAQFCRHHIDCLTKVTDHYSQLHAATVLVGTGLSQAVQGGKGGRRDSFRKMEKRASHASLDGLPNGESAASTSLQTSTGERQALLNRLEGSEEQRGDLPELLAASAKALQDAGRSIWSWGFILGSLYFITVFLPHSSQWHC